MNDYEVDKVVRRLVRAELMWYRHYWGTVLSTADSLSLGRLQVAVPELRWNDQRSAKWCMPRYAPGLTLPKVGSNVEVYFVEGNPRRPVWLGRVPELGETLANYTAQTKEVVHEDPASGAGLVFDGLLGMYVMPDGTGSNLVSNAATDLAFWTAMPVLAAMVGLTVTSLQGKFGKGP